MDLMSTAQLLGNVGEFFGAIAVVATLGYLVRQIGLSTRQSKSLFQLELQGLYSSANDLIATNPSLAEMLSRLKDQNVKFAPAETVQITHFAYRMSNIWNAAQIAYDNEQLDEPNFRTYKEDVAAFFNVYPGLTPYFVGVLRNTPSARNYEIWSSIASEVGDVD